MIQLKFYFEITKSTKFLNNLVDGFFFQIQNHADKQKIFLLEMEATKNVFHSNFPNFFLFFSQPDSSGQVTSSPLGSPTSHRGMHPSLLSPTSMGPSGSLHSPISTLSSPMNGLASPFSVISSPMGPHSMNSPGMGYGASVSPQVRPVIDSQACR